MPPAPIPTTDEVLQGVDLTGTTALITGASSGLGVETARALATHGAQLVLGVRDTEQAADALDEAGVPDASFALLRLDLGDLASVRSFADRVLADVGHLDVVICNAGVMACPERRTVDGFESQLGVNHLGHFALVSHLVPLLARSAPARVVVLSSAGHRISDVDLDDPWFEATPYDPWVAYGRSKSANALFAAELDRRLRDQGVRAASVHPGEIQTGLGRHLTRESVGLLTDRLQGREMVFRAVEQGAATSVWAATVAGADTIGGRYCEDVAVAEVTDDPSSTTGVSSRALDPERAAALWAASERWVGERPG